MTPYTIGTAFSGIGVPDLAARLLGMETVFQIEKDEFCQRVLRKHFPEATLYGDIFDVSNPPYVDVFAAGFPCQPFSVAGRRQGERDERYLVPEMLRVIDETKPRVCLLENVPGFASLDDGRTFKRLLGALAEMGMDAEWGHLRASDFGAPHQRERWWLVAHSASSEWVAGRKITGELRAQMGDTDRNNTYGYGGELGYADSERLQGQRTARQSVMGTRYRAWTSEGTGYRGNGERATQSRLGRVLDGTAHRLDGFVPYPARPGQAQFDFEPPRVTTRKDLRAARLKALGNTMAFDVAFALMAAIQAWLISQDEAVIHDAIV